MNTIHNHLYAVLFSKLRKIICSVVSASESVTCTEMKPNMELFQKAALNVSPKWRLIGKHFGLPENLLDEIKLSATSKGNMYAFEMVRKAWKIYLKLNVIIRTLESPKVNEQVVAKYLNGKLKGKYCA